MSERCKSAKGTKEIRQNLLKMQNSFLILVSIEASRDIVDSAMTKTMSRWNKFRDLVPLFASKCFILGGNSRLYSAYVNCVMLHRDKTWPVKEKGDQTRKQWDKDC